MTLSEIVRTRNLKALESFCLQRTHLEVKAIATREGVDLEELEELLQEIS